jgi:hypothetical protein
MAGAHAAVIRPSLLSVHQTGPPVEDLEIGVALMDSQQLLHQAGDRARRGCLVAGCPCKDARIVSQRRAAFFAAWARDHGETANRAVEPEADWQVPTLLSSVA